MDVNYSEMTTEQIAIINEYCENDMRKLKRICHFVWGKKGLPNCYHDDLYSDAINVLSESVVTFNPDENTKFKTYLTNNIRKSYGEWYRNTHLRAKRNNLELDEYGKIKRDEEGNPFIIPNISFDAPADDEIDLCEKIASDFSIEDNINKEEMYDENTKSYLNELSPTQNKIAKLIMDGYELSDIKEKLKLNDKQFNNHMKYMRSFEKSSILKRENVNTNIEMEEKPMNNNQTNEKSKPEKYSIASIIKKMNNGMLRYDHPLQRASDQHSTKMKSNLISDILQGNPIPELVFAEQIINGISIIWNLDGKQRSTNAKEFSEDKFRISKNVRRGIIKYQAIIKDENGQIIPDENGFPQAEWREFDIRNKRFSQLPTELQDKFMDYCFNITLYLNCSDADIAYHMERYNEGKQMVSSQKGVIKLGEDYARMIKGISAMPFFSENGFNYTQKKNGTIDRVCIESVMATEFLDNWKTSPEDIATFLKKNATEEHFDNLEDTVERLEKVVTEDVGEMFNKKDTFIYFSVFARFKKTGLDDGKFVEFLTEYAQSLHIKFNEIENKIEDGKNKKRSTKDKCVVIEKINCVEALMNEYLHIEDKESENNKIDNKEITTKDIIKEFVNSDVTDEDIELYELIANDKSEVIDNLDSWLLSEENRTSFVALVSYAAMKEIEDELDKWLPIYERDNTYISNPKQNYLHMVNDFDKYCNRKVA